MAGAQGGLGAEVPSQDQGGAWPDLSRPLTRGDQARWITKPLHRRAVRRECQARAVLHRHLQARGPGTGAALTGTDRQQRGEALMPECPCQHEQRLASPLHARPRPFCWAARPGMARPSCRWPTPRPWCRLPRLPQGPPTAPRSPALARPGAGDCSARFCISFPSVSARPSTEAAAAARGQGMHGSSGRAA